MTNFGKKLIDVSVLFDKDLVKKAVIGAAMQGLTQLGEVIAGEAMNEVPRLSGTLGRSITVTKGGLPNADEVYEKAKKEKVIIEKKQGNNLEVYISANTPYARKQHEETAYRHPNGGGAKYLERPFNALKNQAEFYAERMIADKVYKKKVADLSEQYGIKPSEWT